jgi:hypothetical protein
MLKTAVDLTTPALAAAFMEWSLAVALPILGQQLDRDDPAQLPVPGAKQLARSAAAYQLQNLVTRNRREPHVGLSVGVWMIAVAGAAKVVVRMLIVPEPPKSPPSAALTQLCHFLATHCRPACTGVVST